MDEKLQHLATIMLVRQKIHQCDWRVLNKELMVEVPEAEIASKYDNAPAHLLMRLFLITWDLHYASQIKGFIGETGDFAMDAAMEQQETWGSLFRTCHTEQWKAIEKYICHEWAAIEQYYQRNEQADGSVEVDTYYAFTQKTEAFLDWLIEETRAHQAHKAAHEGLGND
jgi:hypothetical protein